MKKKSLNFILPLVVYPFDIMVSFGQTDKEVIAALNKYGITDEDELKLVTLNGVGRYCMFSNNASLIRLWTYPEYAEDYGTLAHEIFHAVTFILDKTGMDIQLKVSDEAYSYLIGYITTQIYKRLK